MITFFPFLVFQIVVDCNTHPFVILLLLLQAVFPLGSGT